MEALWSNPARSSFTLGVSHENDLHLHRGERGRAGCSDSPETATGLSTVCVPSG